MKKIALSMLILGACSGGDLTAIDASPADAAVPDARRPPDARAPDAPPPDAPPPDAPSLACLGQPSPTTAPDPVPILGKVFAVAAYQIAPVVGATVSVHRRADDGILAQATTGDDGSFMTQVASGGAPVDAYFTVDAPGKLPSRTDPGTPLVGGEGALLIVADDAEVGRWSAAAGASHATGQGAVLVAAVDCDRASLGGTTLAVTPAPASLTYYDDVAKLWDPRLAASTNGYTLLTGTAATVMVTASRGAQTYPTRTVIAPAGTLTVAVLPPRR